MAGLTLQSGIPAHSETYVNMHDIFVYLLT